MKRICFATALLFFACATKKDDPTKLAITNSNTFSVTTVTVTSTSDSSKVATFSSLAANSTAATQEISFSGQATIACTNSGCNSGTITISSAQTNTVTILTNTVPGAPATTSSGGGSGW